MLRVPPIAQMLMNQLRGNTKSAAQVPNPANQSFATNVDPFATNLFRAEVLRSGPAMYDAVVRIPGMEHALPCVIGSELSGYNVGTGTLASHQYLEGTNVIVWLPDRYSKFGVILGQLPPQYAGKQDGTTKAHIQKLDPEGAAASYTDSAYKLPSTDTRYRWKVNNNAGRPIDLFPGNLAWLNEYGVGVSLQNLMATLRGSEFARIDVFMLDDLVRMVSGQFQHFSAFGEQQIYDDYGGVTMEMTGSPHRCEVFGLDEFNKAWTKEDKPDWTKDKTCNLGLKDKILMSRRRYQLYFGYLGNLFQFFVATPDPDIKTYTYSSEAYDRGLMQFGVDTSGRLVIRSAGGILIQRSDRIGIPKKLKEPWDPEGDKKDNPGKQKEPFGWSDEKYPESRSAQIRDAYAWYLKVLYLRVIEHSKLDGKKDYFLPEDVQLKDLVDDYEKIGTVLGKEDFKKNKDKTGLIWIGEDGVVIIRGEGGAELQLAGGKAILTAPLGVEVRSGKTAAILGGDDVVIKGRRSVDVMATEKDLRLKSKKNMQLLSTDGGVLVESTAKNDYQQFKGKKGEDISSAGVILKAEKSRVLVWANFIHMAVIRQMAIEAIKKTGGALVIALDKILGLAKTTLFTAQEGGTLLASGGVAAVLGQTTTMIAKRSCGIVQRAKVLIPFKWQEIQSDPYDPFERSRKPIWDRFFEKDDWLGEPYRDSTKQREAIKFKYRTEKQYGTQDSKQRIYEAFWQFAARTNQLKDPSGQAIKVEGWKETHEVEKTMAWPGYSRYLGGGKQYYELDREENILPANKGIPKNYKERKPKSGTFQPLRFGDFKVTKD